MYSVINYQLLSDSGAINCRELLGKGNVQIIWYHITYHGCTAVTAV